MLASKNAENDPVPSYLKSLSALRAEFRARGWETPATGRVIAEAVVHIVVVGVGTGLFLWNANDFVAVLGILIAAVGSFGIATNTHTPSHRAASKSSRLDSALTFLGYSFFLGFSATYWRHKHVAAHHRAPNVVGIDDDINLAPFFAITDLEHGQAGPWAKRWYAVQWLVMPLAIGLNSFSMAFAGARFLASRLSDARQRRSEHWLDLAMLASHVSFWLVLPSLLLPVATVVGFYLVRMVILGYLLFAAFAPAHLPEEATILEAASSDDPVMAVAATTLNIRTGRLGNFLCSGVDYQIEHHLFPRYSHVYYPEMAPLVEAYFRHHGYPYRSVGWGEGVWKSLVIFRRPKRVERLTEAKEATKLIGRLPKSS